MAKISVESTSKINSGEELVDFIALNLYKPDNKDLFEAGTINSLPKFVQYVAFIFDFETEFEMQGLYALLKNTTGRYLPFIKESFENTGNTDISELLEVVLSSGMEYPDKIEERLSELIADKTFWYNVVKTTDQSINEHLKSSR